MLETDSFIRTRVLFSHGACLWLAKSAIDCFHPVRVELGRRAIEGNPASSKRDYAVSEATDQIDLVKGAENSRIPGLGLARN